MDPIFSSEKTGVTTSILSITASTLASTLHKFPTRKTFKCFIQSFCRIVLKEIPNPFWPTHYSSAYNLLELSPFNENGYTLPKSNFIWLHDKVHSQNSPVAITDYFQNCLFNCVRKFCTTHLNCCNSCGVKSRSFCLGKCSECVSRNHLFYFCPKLLRWLHKPDTPHHLLWKILSEPGLSHAHHLILKHKVECYQETGVTCFDLNAINFS